MGRKTKKIINAVENAAALLIIAAVLIRVNKDVCIKALYMDDLYMWSCYGEQSLLKFIFPAGSSVRFRPVYWFLTYLQMMIVGNNVENFLAFNFAVNILTAWLVYYFSHRITGNRWLAFLCGICYAVSRFAYYQIGQALGYMETLGTAMSLTVLYLLFRYTLAPSGVDFFPAAGIKCTLKNEPRYFAALLVYFLLSFVHERYIVLAALFIVAELLCFIFGEKNPGDFFKEHKKRIIAPFAAFVLIMLIRTLATGSFIPAGTGGTKVSETITPGSVFENFISQIFYIEGVNYGPEYLSGVHWENVPVEIKNSVKFGIIVSGIIILMFVSAVLVEFINKKTRKYFPVRIKGFVIFASFIGLCIGTSSVTIRVEMRWIYASYAAFVMFTAYMAAEIEKIYRGKAKRLDMFCLTIYLLFTAKAAFSVYTDVKLRAYWENIYFWENQERMNSLCEQTIEKYGREGVFGKNVYILENTYEMTDFYAETFFKPFDKNRTAGGTVIKFIQTADEITAPDREKGCIVLKEEPQNRAYRDITPEITDAIGNQSKDRLRGKDD